MQPANRLHQISQSLRKASLPALPLSVSDKDLRLTSMGQKIVGNDMIIFGEVNSAGHSSPVIITEISDPKNEEHSAPRIVVALPV